MKLHESWCVSSCVYCIQCWMVDESFYIYIIQYITRLTYCKSNENVQSFNGWDLLPIYYCISFAIARWHVHFWCLFGQNDSDRLLLRSIRDRIRGPWNRDNDQQANQLVNSNLELTNDWLVIYVYLGIYVYLINNTSKFNSI